jgi:hypothetical protein
MTPEGRIEAYLKQQVERTGGSIRKLAWVGRRGAPDRLIWWPGPSFAFVEVKAANGKLSTLQEREIGRLRAAGFQVAVVFCKEDVDEVVFALTQPVGCIQ